MSVTRAFSLVLLLSVTLAPGLAFAASAAPPKAVPLGDADAGAPRLLRQMAGTWAVQQKMWPGAGAQAVDLPPAVARRQLVGGAYLEETMQLAPGSKQPPFTRTAYFNYNVVTHRYEYASLDTRAPQLMVEKGTASTIYAGGTIALQGGEFTAPKWGAATNVRFRYRLSVGPVEHGRQIVRLYLTPLSGTARKEFLAFEYVYTCGRALSPNGTQPNPGD